MMSPLTKARFWVLTLFLLVTGCVSPEEAVEDSNSLRPTPNVNTTDELANANVNTNSNTAEDDLGKLKEIINLPFEPEFNNYRVEPMVRDAISSKSPQPNDRKLTVVMKFSAEDTESLGTQLRGTKAFQTETLAEDWFPSELVAIGNTSGDGSLKATGYSSQLFAKPPFNKGSLIRINDTDYFVLILQTR